MYSKQSILLRSIIITCFFLTIQLTLGAQSSEIDGPYVKYDHESTILQWTFPEAGSKGSAEWTGATTDLPKFDGFHPETFDPMREFPQRDKLVFKDIKRVAALSDIHGQYEVARKLLIAHGIMDTSESWTFGDGHLVIVGDVFDRGDQVNAALWLIYHLQVQAEKAGGGSTFYWAITKPWSWRGK